MKILIYGVGEMGSLFYNFFSSRGYTVKGFDLVEERKEIGEENIKDFDVIFLCVPMEEISSVASRLRNLSLSNQLLVDVSSIKALSTSLEESEFDYLSIHPLFGGDSEILSDIIVTHESEREEEKVILKEFENAGARLIRMKAEDHDRLMAVIQGIPHLILISIASFASALADLEGREAETPETPIFGVLKELAARVVNQDWRMSYLIQKNAEKAREKFLEHLKSINEILRSESRVKELFADLREKYKKRDSLFIETWKACRDRDRGRDLNLLRSSISKIDLLILKLLERRVELAKKIAQEKEKKGIPIENLEVEKRKLEILASKTSLNPLLLTSIFEGIIRLTKEEECKVLGLKKRLAVLGPPGSYSEEIALRLVGSKLPLRYCSSIHEVVELTEKGDFYGIIPIENSISGTVFEALDALLNHRVKVFGEAKLQIKHCLAAKRRIKMDEIEVVYSHPQAVTQCMDFIRNYLPSCEIRYTSSTSDAAKLLDSAEKSAAILSENAAKFFRLHVLRRIENQSQESVTRFYLIRKEGMGESTEEKKVSDGEWVTSLFFEVENRPGALKKVLDTFYEKGINLRKLESRPRGFGNYVFFSELEACLDEKDLKALKKVTTFYRLIGVFKEVEKLVIFERFQC